MTKHTEDLTWMDELQTTDLEVVWFDGSNGWALGKAPILYVERKAAAWAIRNGWKQAASGWIYDDQQRRRFVDWLDLADWLEGSGHVL